MLTKEECEKAYEIVKDVFYIEFCPKEAEEENIKRPSWDDFVNSMDLLEKMIKEHFSNPPLKFDELEENMWVWDNNWNQYFKIYEIYPKTKEFDVLIHQNRINKLRYEPMKFEENRFYRKEVQK